MEEFTQFVELINALGTVGALVFLFRYSEGVNRERIAEWKAREAEANARADRYLALLLRTKGVALKTDIGDETGSGL